MTQTKDAPLIFAPETYQYDKGHLSENEVASSPIEQFHEWFKYARDEVKDKEAIIPESTTFSTARLPSGRISSRIVLLKELDNRGFIVYSNWDKLKKSQDRETNPYASLCFFWPHVQRQVRVEGLMELVDRETTERYFATRPRGSKIGAWASPQSQPLASRDELADKYEFYENKFKDLKDDEIPCPEYWGGVRIVPLEVEFWQGGMSRLHDRITFVRDSESASWTLVRISP